MLGEFWMTHKLTSEPKTANISSQVEPLFSTAMILIASSYLFCIFRFGLVFSTIDLSRSRPLACHNLTLLQSLFLCLNLYMCWMWIMFWATDQKELCHGFPRCLRDTTSAVRLATIVMFSLISTISKKNKSLPPSFFICGDLIEIVFWQITILWCKTGYCVSVPGRVR